MCIDGGLWFGWVGFLDDCVLSVLYVVYYLGCGLLVGIGEGGIGLGYL